jgi:hypothetical protein
MNLYPSKLHEAYPEVAKGLVIFQRVSIDPMSLVVVENMKINDGTFS